ncbi:MAG: hypothetical protein J7502_09770 [Flavisolibacter sp.]|nr:hypothetical protein [Flavisolibacter sp.]
MVQKEKELEASDFAETLQKLNQETEFINSVLDASLDGIFVCEAIRDKSGIIVDLLIKRINSAFMHIHKIEEPVVGRRYLSFFPSAKEIGLFELYRQVIDTGTPGYNEFDYNDQWFQVSAVKLGENGLVITFHDFSDYKRLQLQLEQKAKELETLNRNLEYFVFASSHDLKEPLRKALLFADRLKTKYKSVLDEEGGKYFERMEASIHRLKKLVDDMLVYSGLNQEQDSNQVVDLNVVVKEVVKDLELHFNEKKASLHMDRLPVINGNPRQFHLLFQSLIENSLKFSVKDLPVEISITATKITGKSASIPLPSGEWNNPFYQIVIKDNGIGFDQQYTDRIFKVFQRLNSGYPGSGMGLFVARKVVKNHNGWIGAASEKNKGTTVSIVIPAG